MKPSYVGGTLILLSVIVLLAVGGGRESRATAAATITIDAPKSNEQIRVSRGSDGLSRVVVRGQASGVGDNLRLLLWLHPVRPAAEGWYLQRPPINGVSPIAPGGAWTGTAQLGSLQWPPRQGDEFEIAITAVDKLEAMRLLAEGGVVVRNQPVGTTLATATGLLAMVK